MIRLNKVPNDQEIINPKTGKIYLFSARLNTPDQFDPNGGITILADTYDEIFAEMCLEGKTKGDYLALPTQVEKRDFLLDWSYAMAEQLQKIVTTEALVSGKLTKLDPELQGALMEERCEVEIWGDKWNEDIPLILPLAAYHPYTYNRTRITGPQVYYIGFNDAEEALDSLAEYGLVSIRTSKRH